jgi:hypothetical protein
MFVTSELCLIWSITVRTLHKEGFSVQSQFQVLELGDTKEIFRRYFLNEGHPLVFCN